MKFILVITLLAPVCIFAAQQKTNLKHTLCEQETTYANKRQESSSDVEQMTFNIMEEEELTKKLGVVINYARNETALENVDKLLQAGANPHGIVEVATIIENESGFGMGCNIIQWQHKTVLEAAFQKLWSDPQLPNSILLWSIIDKLIRAGADYNKLSPAARNQQELQKIIADIQAERKETKETLDSYLPSALLQIIQKYMYLSPEEKRKEEAIAQKENLIFLL